MYGRRRAPEDDEPPPPPPAGQPPYRPRRQAESETGPLTDRYVPRRANLDNGSAVHHVQSAPAQPIEHDERGHPHRYEPEDWPSPPRDRRPDPPPGEPGGPERPPRGPRPARGAASVPVRRDAPPPPEAGDDRPSRPLGRARVAPPPNSYDRPTGPADRTADLHSDRAAKRGGRGRPPTPTWMTAVGITAVAVVVAVLVLGGYLMLTGSAAPPAPSDTGPKQRDISTRQADPTPLTEAELFPQQTVTVTDGGRGYPVVKTQAVADCKGVAVGDLAKVLDGLGCTQVIRATMTSADKAYVLTAGVVNLPTEDDAEKLSDAVQTTVADQKGRFAGFSAGGPTDIFAKAATQVGWDVRGHYLAYGVVARVDGKPIDAGDQTVRQMIDDLVEKYLMGTVLQARVAPPAPAPAGSAPPNTKNPGTKNPTTKK